MPDAPPETPEAGGRRAASGFRRLAWIVLGGLVVLATAVGGTLGALYLAATATVPEYEEVVEVDPEEAEEDRRAFESQLAALASDAQALPEWSSLVTQRQINAWLALRLARDFPGFRKAGVRAPRVVLREGKILLAARSEQTRVRGVIAVEFEPKVTENDELALQIASARIGAVPLPIDALFAQLRETPLGQLGPIRLAKSGDTATVIVDLERIDTGRDKSLRLTGVNVREGELLLRGESTPIEETAEEETPSE